MIPDTFTPVDNTIAVVIAAAGWAMAVVVMAVVNLVDRTGRRVRPDWYFQAVVVGAVGVLAGITALAVVFNPDVETWGTVTAVEQVAGNGADLARVDTAGDVWIPVTDPVSVGDEVHLRCRTGTFTCRTVEPA